MLRTRARAWSWPWAPAQGAQSRRCRTTASLLEHSVIAPSTCCSIIRYCFGSGLHHSPMNTVTQGGSHAADVDPGRASGPANPHARGPQARSPATPFRLWSSHGMCRKRSLLVCRGHHQRRRTASLCFSTAAHTCALVDQCPHRRSWHHWTCRV